jgi:hypothetical protein
MKQVIKEVNNRPIDIAYNRVCDQILNETYALADDVYTPVRHAVSKLQVFDEDVQAGLFGREDQ